MIGLREGIEQTSYVPKISLSEGKDIRYQIPMAFYWPHR